MSGVMQWLQQQQGGQQGGAPQQPGPANLSALQQAWQRYHTPGTPPLMSPAQQSQQTGLPNPLSAKPPATAQAKSSFLHSLNPSSIRVDFHAPPDPTQ